MEGDCESAGVGAFVGSLVGALDGFGVGCELATLPFEALSVLFFVGCLEVRLAVGFLLFVGCELATFPLAALAVLVVGCLEVRLAVGFLLLFIVPAVGGFGVGATEGEIRSPLFRIDGGRVGVCVT